MSGLHNGTVPATARLDVVGVHARRRARGESPFARLLSAVVIYVFNIEGVDVTRNVAQNSEADVDKQVCADISASQNGHRTSLK